MVIFMSDDFILREYDNQISYKFAAYDLFGEMRELNASEKEDHEKMLEKISNKIDFDEDSIFDLN